jgi:hypothetical protein
MDRNEAESLIGKPSVKIDSLKIDRYDLDYEDSYNPKHINDDTIDYDCLINGKIDAILFVEYSSLELRKINQSPPN